MDRIKKILIALIIIIFLESMAIVTLHHKIWVNTDLTIGLNYRDVVTSKLIHNLQGQILQK